MEKHILVVDDEKEIADLVELYLLNEGYIVHKFYSSSKALELIKKRSFDLAVLDIMLPNITGLELLDIIRKTQNYPVIMLTAKITDIDKIIGLASGADDYITKPFNPLELVARVKAQIRRSTAYNDSVDDIILLNGLEINNTNHTLKLYEKDIELTPIEFSILWYLCKNRGKVVASDEMYEKVWGDKFYDSNNTIMVHIRHIREKMGEKSKNPKFIKTVWGVGYKIE